MIIRSLYFLLFLVICSCNNTQKNKTAKIQSSEENEVFFPVTEFLKGQIAEIKDKGITPLRYFIKRDKIDSSWLNMSELNQNFADFLLPEIDSVKLSSLYNAKRFYDQTLNEITLTYEAKQSDYNKQVWMGWNVYINPETGKVDRIYLMKRINEKQTAQLTWIPYKNCKLLNLFDDGDTIYVENEIKTKWDY